MRFVIRPESMSSAARLISTGLPSKVPNPDGLRLIPISENICFESSRTTRMVLGVSHVNGGPTATDPAPVPSTTAPHGILR